MQIHFQQPDAWQKMNKSVLESLPLPLQQRLEAAEVRIYPSVSFAIQEAFWGLKTLFSFKKQAVIFKGQDPYLEEAGKNLAALGVAIAAKPLQCLESFDSLEESLPEVLQRETCFIAYAKNDPLFGKVWPTEKLDSELVKVPCPVLRVDYLSGWNSIIPILPNNLQILGLEGGFAAMILGRKMQFRSIFNANLPWDRLFFESSQWPTPSLSNTGGVEDFLAKISPHFLPFFGKSGEVDPSRIAVYSSAVDGAAITELLAERLPEIRKQNSSYTGSVITPSLSKWGGLKTMDWVHGWGHDLKKIRGTIIVDRTIISDKFIKTLLSVYFHLLELQNGDQRSDKNTSFND